MRISVAWYATLVLFAASCTSTAEPDPTPPAETTTTSSAATTTTALPPSTTTTTVPKELPLVDYLVAVIDASRAAGVNDLAAELLASPTQAAYADMADALERYRSGVERLGPPDEAAEFHRFALENGAAWVSWYRDFSDALAAGDQDALLSLQEESLKLISDEVGLGRLQRELSGIVLGSRGDRLSSYVLEASLLAERVATDIQGIFTRLQVVLSSAEPDFEGLLALLDEEAVILRAFDDEWGALDPPGEAIEYHSYQGHLIRASAAGLEAMGRAIQIEDIELFQGAIIDIQESVGGATIVGELQTELLRSVLLEEATDSEAEWVWMRAPAQRALREDFGRPVSIWSVSAIDTGFVGVGSTAVFSSDGITWLQASGLEMSDPLTFSFASMADVTLGGPGLIAVGSESADDGPAAAVWTSIDGTEWQRLADDVITSDGENPLRMTRVAAGAPGLVAFGTEGSASEMPLVAAWSSPTGTAWEQLSLDPSVFGQDFIADVIAWGSGFLAFGSALWTSPDGRNWARHELGEVVGPDIDGGFLSVAAGGPGLVAVGLDRSSGDADAAVWVSADGFTWDRIDDVGRVLGGSGDQRMAFVVAGDFGFLAGGSDGAYPDSRPAFWASEDGLAWTRVEVSAAFLEGEGPWLPIAAVVGGSRILVIGSQDVEGQVWIGFPPG
jgi:hypothetical protein